MKKIELRIVALSHSVSQSNNYAVVLGEMVGLRRIPIVIGSFEAQAIAVAMEKMTPNRPLTHDLFKQTLEAFKVEIKEIIINNLLDGIFYARLICEREGEIIELDSRTSDAIALAVRFQCPIFTYEFILDTAGVELDESTQADIEEESDDEMEEKPGKNKQSALSTYSLESLQNMLLQVLEEENYEKAATIRDEIDKRKRDLD
ncbi:MAG: bifunctional nuclease domain-containing protein [Saprospiraceae bacterium]|jgi:bifunctional DNase/RNase